MTIKFILILFQHIIKDIMNLLKKVLVSFFLFFYFSIFSNLYSKFVAKDFLWGVIICEYQNSGAINCPTSNWAYWEQKTHSDGQPTIKNGQTSGTACDFWNSYKEQIKLAKDLGINSIKLSLAWDRLEPEKGKFDEGVFKHYDDVIQCLIDNNIVPNISLHHQTHPQWFEEIGGFEYEENIKYFVRFCKKMFEHYSDRVNLWTTIGEPTTYVLQAYLRGVFPPGYKNIQLAFKVLKNLMKAHYDVYSTLKEMPNGDKSEIGLVHQYLKFKPFHKWNPIEYAPGLLLNYLMTDSVLDFLKTGNFEIGFPYLCHYSYKVPRNKKIIDFIGLNYYSRVLVKFQFSFKEPLKPSCYSNEIMTDMPYALYPEGFYEALKDVSKLNVPIHVTESGIPDAKDDRREKFFKEYIQISLFKALKEGVDIRSFYYWTLIDNFEWDEGYNMKFGLYSFDNETKEIKIRKSAKLYRKIIDKSKDYIDQ